MLKLIQNVAPFIWGVGGRGLGWVLLKFVGTEWGGSLTMADTGHEECNVPLNICREGLHLGYKLRVVCD